MKKKLILLMLALSMICIPMVGCGSNGDQEAAEGNEAETAEATNEVTDIHWAQANSGNVFVTVAQEMGYFDEYGLNVTEDPIDGNFDALTALGAGQIDVVSNYGTDLPLQSIASGSDFTIVGGYMLQGMYIVAPKGTGWNGVEDLVGKTIGGYRSEFSVTGALLDAGYDPMKDVTWVECESMSDFLSAVISGKADYGILSGDLLYSVNNNPDVEIVTYLGDIMPNYGCCRMVMRTDFVKDNPTTVKNLMKALIRAEGYLRSNKEECVKMLAKKLDREEDYVAAYLMNPKYVPSVDPVKNSTLRAWDILQKTGFLDENAADIDISQHIDTSFYETALKECTEEFGSEDPEYYKERQEFFDANNK